MAGLQPGHFSPRRDAYQIEAIKQAIAAGKPFRDFWVETAAAWPCHLHLASLSTFDRAKHCSNMARLRHGSISALPNANIKSAEYKQLYGVYKYYAYRQHGDARFVNGVAAQPFDYTDVQRLIACRAAAARQPFAVFWSIYARHWDKPMYRLRNWYRGLQKRWRDIVTVSPNMTEADRALAVAAMAAGGTSCRRQQVPMLSLRRVPLSAEKAVAAYLRRHLGVSQAVARAGIAGQRFVPCVRRDVNDVAATLRNLFNVDAAVVS